MGTFPVLTRARLVVLTVAVATAGVFCTQAGAAAAAPAPTTPHSSSSRSHSSPTTASRSGTVTRKPNAVAPPGPAPTAPPCTTDTDKKYPVVCLPKGSGEDRPASLTPGDDVEFDAQVVNQGVTPVSGATVTITLPAGLQLESDEDDPVYRIDDWYTSGDDADFTDLDCMAASAGITCKVGDLAAGDNILIGIDLEVADDARTGTTLRFGVTLHPDAQLPAEDTSVEASITVLAPSHLVVSLTPATLSAVVGRTATMVGSVHNAGSGAAPDTAAIALAANNNDITDTHFEITNGSDLTGDPTGGDVGGGSSVVFGRHVSKVTTLLQRHAVSRSAASSKKKSLPSVKFWPVGTLAAGATSRVTIKLKARSAGEDSLTFGAFSDTDDSCDFSGGGDDEGGSASVTPVVRAPQAASTTTAADDCSSVVQTHITAVAASTTSSSAAPLANTGSRALDVQLGIAVWAVVLGGLLVWVGRRRRVAGRHLG
ncbi:hypothetical protein [uncultured Jatrophihabitans sp.]|uniref:hypothetical protein n=1 Tax=uncultured Jatrophihabitans sp. TaxID=1610747 RepID=UPI0035CB04F3